MGISIKNDEVEAMIRLAAEAMDKPLTDAVREVTAEWLHTRKIRLRSEEEERQKKIDESLAELRRWPVYDDRDHGDMLYDENGLPK
jgi:hypothetical protein